MDSNVEFAEALGHAFKALQEKINNVQAENETLRNAMSAEGIEPPQITVDAPVTFEPTIEVPELDLTAIVAAITDSKVEIDLEPIAQALTGITVDMGPLSGVISDNLKPISDSLADKQDFKPLFKAITTEMAKQTRAVTALTKKIDASEKQSKKTLTQTQNQFVELLRQGMDTKDAVTAERKITLTDFDGMGQPVSATSKIIN